MKSVMFLVNYDFINKCLIMIKSIDINLVYPRLNGQNGGKDAFLLRNTKPFH